MRICLAVVLVAYVGGLLVLTLWPDTTTTPGAAGASKAIHSAQSNGAPSGFNWASVEWVANILVFIPVTLLLALLLPLRRWYLAAIAGVLLSVAIEATQHWFLPGRDASVRDLVTNSIGSVVGAALVAGFALIRAKRRNTVQSRLP